LIIFGQQIQFGLYRPTTDITSNSHKLTKKIHDITHRLDLVKLGSLNVTVYNMENI